MRSRRDTAPAPVRALHECIAKPGERRGAGGIRGPGIESSCRKKKARAGLCSSGAGFEAATSLLARPTPGGLPAAEQVEDEATEQRNCPIVPRAEPFEVRRPL